MLDPKSEFLSPEGFEEIQAKLRAGNLPLGPLGMVLPPPPRIVSEPHHPSFGPPGFQPYAFPPPVAAFPSYPLQSPVPGAPIPPRTSFPPMHQEVHSHPPVIVHPPTVIGPTVIGMHPAQIPGPGREVIQVVHQPGVIPGHHGQFVPFRPNLSGPHPPDIRGGPFMPDPRGPYPTDVRGPYLPDPRAQFPPDIRGQFPHHIGAPYLGDPRVPYPPNIHGSLPPESGAPVRHEVRGTVSHDFHHPPNHEGHNTPGIADMTRHQPPFVPGDGSRGNLQSEGPSLDGCMQSSPGDSFGQSPGDTLQKKMWQNNSPQTRAIPSRTRTNLIYPIDPDT